MESILVGPLLQLLSVQFLSLVQRKSLSISGRIYAQFRDSATGEIIVHDFYNRDSADILDSDGRLTLTTPDYSLRPFDICMPLDRVSLVVDVHVGDNNLFTVFQCGEYVDDFEIIKVENISCDFGTLALHYSVIPFGVQAWINVSFSRKQGYAPANPSLHLNGTIVAHSGDVPGSYQLFDKKSSEFERLDFDMATKPATLRLSSCWLCISAHSSLIIDFDLSEYGMERRILKESIEFQVRKSSDCYEKFIVDDFLIDVNVARYSPKTQGICLDDESSGDETSSGEEQSDDERMSESSGDETSSGEEESDDEQMSEACIPIVPSELSRPRQLCAHEDIPLSSWALQIYSIFIGRKMASPLQIYGSVKVSAPPRTYYVFNREDSDAYCMLEHEKTMPVQNGCGAFEDYDTLKIKFDLKDISSELVIRGHVTWHRGSFDHSPRRMDKQLCSVVEGEDGFAAIHYSLFSEAVQAKLELLCKRKDERVHASPMVVGSLVACYNNYDYTTRYNKDYHRICLFERNREDPAQAEAGGVISLARHVVAVPLGSSLVVEANLFDAATNEGVTGTLEFRMGCSDPMILEGENHRIFGHIKWEEVGK